MEYPGAIYHVSCRMIGDAPSPGGYGGTSWPTDKSLFRDDADRKRFIERLAERVEQYDVRLYLYVLMTNHFHLVFETPEGNCSKFMQALSTAYTVYYNLRHSRHGHLLDGRYKAKLVEGDAYLLALSRYVHQNPVYAGAVKNKPVKEKIQYLRQYPWSSYRSYIGEDKALDFVDYGPMLAEMGGKRGIRPKRYREFVESSLVKEDEEFKESLKASPRSIGGDSFRRWVDEVYQKLVEKRDVREDVSFRRITEPLDPGQVLEVLAEVLKVDVGEFKKRRRDSVLRGFAARLLIRYGGLTQREVAGILGMATGSAVSVQMRNAAAVLAEDSVLSRQEEKAVSRLAKLRETEGAGSANTYFKG